MSPRRIHEIVQTRRAITADTDLRLARYFGLSDGFFLQLQSDHDLLTRRRQIGTVLDAIEPRAASPLPPLMKFRGDHCRLG